MAYKVPDDLQRAILSGRCIAFVGAGFSAGVVPPWHKFLQKIATELGERVATADSATAFELEAVGQRLKDIAGDRWERIVHKVLEDSFSSATPAARERLDRRRELLESIPFKAILTTNFDPSLRGVDTTTSMYWEVLRTERRWWSSAPSRESARSARTPVVKLHGDANGDPLRAPIVLGRADYRRRVYEDHSYGSFLRAAFAGYTLLFLGVSFTDAYLNELRSDVLKTIRGCDDDCVWGYAVMNKPAADIKHFFRRYEGVEVLPDETADHAGFDAWLDAISSATSVEGRLRSILEGKRIVWLDPNPQNNERGFELLTKSSLAQVEQLRHASELDERAHADADVILSNFGYAAPDDAHAFRVLDKVRTWRERPPVIVFAAHAPPEQLRTNRNSCLRRGAYEYAVEWGELYRAVEALLGRVPGDES